MRKFFIILACLVISASLFGKEKKYRAYRMKKTAPASGWVDNWQEYYQSKAKK